MKIKERIKKCFSKAKKLVAAVGTAVVVGVTMAVSSFAAETDPSGSAEAVAAAKTVLSSITEVLNITAVAAILAACMGSATALFLAWWGVRKVTKVTVRAFSHGKLAI